MRLTTFFILALVSTLAFGQSKPVSKSSVKDTLQYNLQKAIYKSALRYSDLAVAKSAVYSLMALSPSDKTLRDTLLFLYFNGGSFGQSVLLSREILAEAPSNATVMEIKAVSEQNLGLIKESLESYEKLYAQTKNIYHLYQVSVLQYQLKRYGECNASIESILKDEKALTEKVSINLGEKESQEVVLKAATLNIRGVMQLETKREAEAKASFEEALKLQPDFELAKNNLSLTQKKAQPTPATKKPAGK